jgi:hypothetical protein
MIAAANAPYRIAVATRRSSCGQAPAEPFTNPEDPDEPSELEDPTVPWPDDDRWDVFLPDDDRYEPQPEPGDFWIDFDD